MLTVETGEGLANADSFVTLAEARAFASSRGATLSAVDATLEQQVRTAHDYLLRHESRFLGYRAKDGQALLYPRAGVTVFGRTVADNAIPKQLKDAVCQLLIEQLTRDLLPSSDGQKVSQETVGPISTTYVQTGAVAEQPSFPRVEAFLAPLLRNGGQLQTVRV
jgi:hypothetical protein